MCRRGPLTFADDGQSGAVNDEVQAGARAGAPKREGEMLTASRERGVIGGREIDAQHPEDRGQDALGLTQRSVEEETERQGGFDGEIGILELPAPPADASRCPRGDRVRREPEGDVASPHEGSVVLGPVPDAIRCLVLRMHSRLHIEIMTRRRSRWSTCRPLLAHRPESAHQRLLSQLRKGDVVVVWTLDRLSRSLRDVLTIMERVQERHAGFRSLKEAVDTTTPAGRMMMQMVGAFAEFERAMLKERTKAGLDAARKEGRIGGRPPKLKPHQQQEIVTLVKQGKKTAADAARLFGVHPATVSRLLRRT